MLAPAKNEIFQPRLEANGTITRLPFPPEPTLPTWDEYLFANEVRKNEIGLLWKHLAGRYIGNGSQAVAARELDLRRYAHLVATGKVRAQRRPLTYSTNPLDDDRAIIISEHEMRDRDGAYDAWRDAEGHR